MLNHIKSKYVLQKIVFYLCPKSYLKIFKHNKNLRKKLEIPKKNYENYNQIEIEITPIDIEKNSDKHTIILN